MAFAGLTQPAALRPRPRLFNLLDDLQFLPSSLRDSACNLVRSKRLNRIVRQRVRSQSPLRHRVGGTTQVNIINNRIASVVRVGKEDGLVGAVNKGRALDQDLRIHAAVDTGQEQAVPVVVDNVDCSEADQGGTAVDVVPVVVGVCDVQLSLILVGVAVGVADQRGFPLLQSVWVNLWERGGGTWSWK